MHTVITNCQQLEQLFKLLSAELNRTNPKSITRGTSTPMEALLNGGFACYGFDPDGVIIVMRVPNVHALMVEIDHAGDLPSNIRRLLDCFIEGKTLPCHLA